MRIALITRRYPPLIGGAEKVLSYLALALAAEGAEVTVLTSRLDERLPAREDVPTPRGALTVRRLATSPVRVVGTWLYMRNLRRWLERNPPDLAYVSMLKHDAYVTLGVARRRRFLVVLRPEGAGATGDIAWQSWGRFGRQIGRRCRHADAFITISPAIEHELRQAWTAGTMRESLVGEVFWPSPPEPRIVAIPNGVPVPETPWQRRDGWRQAPRAVFVGRLAPEKGLDTLIDAWPRVLEVHPTARLVLVGEGPQRPALEDQIQRLGLGEAVAWPGRVDDASPWLRDADLFILPSREEGMSIALLEAMALGVPLVASAIPGNRKLVADFTHGRLAPPDQPSELARVILEQWDQFDRAIHMARAARKHVVQHHSIAAVARRHLELFQTLIPRR